MILKISFFKLMIFMIIEFHRSFAEDVQLALSPYSELIGKVSIIIVCKQVKGISREDMETRCDLVLALAEKIEAIPAGATNLPNQTGGWETSGPNKNVKFDSGQLIFQYTFRY